MKTACVFTGQGAQRVGMAQAMYNHPQFKQHFQMTDDILGFALSQLILEGPQEKLNQTQYAQLALYAVGYGLYQLGQWDSLVAMAGHSLGEYTALACSGVFSYQEGLRLVALRGELMQAACEQTDGHMVAVLRAQADSLISALQSDPKVVLANHNASDQLVLSGERNAVEQWMEKIKTEKWGKPVSLKVSGAFHSPLMRSAHAPLCEAIEMLDFKTPLCPIIGNVDAEPSQDPIVLKARLKQQMLSPVLWLESMQSLAQLGVQRVIEVGPKKVLLPLVKKQLPEAELGLLLDGL